MMRADSVASASVRETICACSTRARMKPSTTIGSRLSSATWRVSPEAPQETPTFTARAHATDSTTPAAKLESPGRNWTSGPRRRDGAQCAY